MRNRESPISEGLAKLAGRTTLAGVPPPPSNLEPATRDPRKLFITAFVLVAIMLFGGAAILWSYQRYTAKQEKNDRPAMDSNRLTAEKDLPLVRQDGSTAGLFDLSGKISILQTISVGDVESAARAKEVMKRVAAHFSGQADCVFVSLVLDPGPPDKAKANLMTAASELGAKLPQWWVATTDPLVLHKYVKKELKASLFPLYKNGKWSYDTSIVLIDRNRIIRHPVVHQKRGGQPYVGPFDFDQAAEWDARGVKTGTERTNVEELELLLIKTIDELIAEPLKTS